MPKSREILVSVDIEADGPIPGVYSMLSLGATRVDLVGEDFYVELQPISTQYVPEALAVSGLDREVLARTGVEPVEAMRRFKQWLGELDGRPVFASFSSWDWMFVFYYLVRYGDGSPFGHSALDMKSLYMGKYGTDWRDTSKRAIARTRPQLLEGLGPHTHNALDDAREQAELLRRILANHSAASAESSGG
jgi:hypothetical protein